MIRQQRTPALSLAASLPAASPGQLAIDFAIPVLHRPNHARLLGTPRPILPSGHLAYRCPLPAIPEWSCRGSPLVAHGSLSFFFSHAARRVLFRAPVLPRPSPSALPNSSLPPRSGTWSLHPCSRNLVWILPDQDPGAYTLVPGPWFASFQIKLEPTPQYQEPDLDRGSRWLSRLVESSGQEGEGRPRQKGHKENPANGVEEEKASKRAL